MKIINHRDKEQLIGPGCDCDDYLKLKVVAFFPLYNKITVAARHGEDHFFLAPRDQKTDLSDAIPISGRYLYLGDINQAENAIFQQCVLQNKADNWLQLPADNLYITRLLIAGAIRVVVSTEYLTPAIEQTPEYKQAMTDGRIMFICE